MTNSQKGKGDRGEREAVTVLLDLLPPALGELTDRLLEKNPQRKLGAGRAEDTGDLWVLRDCAIQVKNMADINAALRSAAIGAQIQAGHGLLDHALGMSLIGGARIGTVRWLASCIFWPVELEEDAVAVFGNPSLAVRHLRNDRIGVPRHRRVARVERAGKETIWLAPIEAWVAAYAEMALAATTGSGPAQPKSGHFAIAG